jgi:hypothetical protein
MLTKKGFSSSIPIGIGYDMYGRICTQEEKDLLTYKPPICNQGSLADGKGFDCYSQCLPLITSWALGPKFKNDTEVDEFLKLLKTGYYKLDY